jgi:hypothetical protein
LVKMTLDIIRQHDKIEAMMGNRKLVIKECRKI